MDNKVYCIDCEYCQYHEYIPWTGVITIGIKIDPIKEHICSKLKIKVNESYLEPYYSNKCKDINKFNNCKVYKRILPEEIIK